MRIGELGRVTGIEVETIRYYEKAGLVPEPARQANGYRQYTTAHVKRLTFIRHCRALDMPLDDVRRLLGFLDRPEADCADVDRLIDAQLALVRARIDSLRALEAQLATLRGCCAMPLSAETCGILQELAGTHRGIDWTGQSGSGRLGKDRSCS